MQRINSAGFSPRLLDALAHFGLCIDDLPAGTPIAPALAADVLPHLAPGSITLITGPSGCGKSTLLRHTVALARKRGFHIINAADACSIVAARRSRVVDLFPARLSAEHILAVLARVGLGEAPLLARTHAQLSDGQRARLSIALAIEQANTHAHALVFCDEFASLLDRSSARTLCTALSRPAMPTAPALLLAAARDDLPAMLRTDTLVSIGPGHACAIEHPESTPPRIRLRIDRGSYADYRALAHLHYRAARPAMLAPGGILVARTPDSPTPVGVLVASIPTLNGRWRDLAWPGRYRGTSPRMARRINRELRTIARVIVEPRFRASGVARRLIRAYLDDPLTPATEAVAAMGAACPMFARAGMTEYRLPPAPRDARLLDALETRGLSARDLLFTRAAAAVIERDDLMRRELLRWGGASRATRAHAGSTLRLVQAAARTLAAPCVAYAHVRHD